MKWAILFRGFHDFLSNQLSKFHELSLNIKQLEDNLL